ncbi:MAG TPA: dihydroxyacetone kinase subunit DhaL [Solirubrobacteraceae bacterium]|nr:dihydroxyacetone kinase subunit DhaL [Solirubrobacteraceae bacterium]
MSITRDGVVDWMRRFAGEMDEHRQELVRLDTAIGDGDHGTNMDRGMKKALEKLDAADQADAGAALKTVAMALISSVGGAAGPLYGTLFLQMGTALSGQDEIDLAAWTAAWQKGLEGVQARGKAVREDKTMVDALIPAIEAMESASDLDEGLRAAAKGAEEGMRATTPLVARKGRASYLGERSKDHQDPGATSTYYLFKSAEEALAGSG